MEPVIREPAEVVYTAGVARPKNSCRRVVRVGKIDVIVHWTVLMKNLLPNASFELDFGEFLPGNWADMQNCLTLGLSVSGQIRMPSPSFTSSPAMLDKARQAGREPEVGPTIESISDAVDGERAVRVPLEETRQGIRGHLTSPVVRIEAVHLYTLSVFARSAAPQSRLWLGVWIRPLDFADDPDYLSETFELTSCWERYRFTFSTNELERIAVVDLVAEASEPGEVWFDAAQLERGAEATEFATRHPVEGLVVHAAPDPRGRLVHMHDRPLRFDLTTYNSAGSPQEGLRIAIDELLGGEPIAAQPVVGPIPVGHHRQEIRIDRSMIGEFRGRLWSGDAEVGVDDFLFCICPSIPDEAQYVLYSRGGEVGQLPAERTRISWEDPESWFADPPNNLVVTDDGFVNVMADGRSMLRSRDGGRSWEQFRVARPAITVLRDGTFINVSSEDGGLAVHRSEDDGQTYKQCGRIERLGGVESMTELADGALICPVPGEDYMRVFRSEDQGCTWSPGYAVCPGGEPHVVELQSGRLLALVRHNPRVGVGNWHLCFANEQPWRLWMRALQRSDIGSYVKRILLADSEDGGRNWGNVRPGTFLLEEMHGSAVQLPDGRLLMFHTHRVPPLAGGERAKASRDEGISWEPEMYYLNAARAVPGYSASCVLPPHLGDGEPGMVLSVVGERSERNWGHEGAPPTSEGIEFMPRFQAIRWRPLG